MRTRVVVNGIPMARNVRSHETAVEIAAAYLTVNPLGTPVMIESEES